MAHTFNDALPIAKECRPDTILLTTAICQHLKEDIQKMKEAAPAAEIILDGFAL